MQPLAAYLIAEHIQDLRREAAANRLARAAARPARRRPAWRRRASTAVRRLGAALEDLALRLDPTMRRPSYGRE